MGIKWFSVFIAIIGPIMASHNGNLAWLLSLPIGLIGVIFGIWLQAKAEDMKYTKQAIKV